MSKKKLRILLAELDPSETTATLRELYPESQDGLELTIVSTIATLIATIEIVNPEVLLVDLSLAHPDPLEAVRRVHRSAPEVPLIVLAGSSDKNCAEQSLSQGALDYLLKGFIDTRTLGRVLRVALERNTLEGLADLLRDSLTGLYTRDGLLTLRGARDGNGQEQEDHARLAVHENRKSGGPPRRIPSRRLRGLLA
jgi:DNA-binding NtrC family response regulator